MSAPQTADAAPRERASRRPTPPEPQSYANHRRVFPLFHYVALPVAIVNVVVRAVRLARLPSALRAWELAFAIGIAGGFIAARTMALIVQTRVIRLEMRLRLAIVLPPELRPRIPALTPRQLVGLRFASDAELPALVRRCLAGELTTADQVKRQIVQWQADHLRA